jgi:hypothetical protein
MTIGLAAWMYRLLSDEILEFYWTKYCPNQEGFTSSFAINLRAKVNA